MGSATGDGTALRVELGFRPMHVVAINVTDATRFEKLDSMANANTLQTVTAGTTTVTTTSQITIDDTGFTILAATFAATKVFNWFAQ